MKIARFFILSAGALFFLTAVAKLVSAFGAVRLLNYPAPFLFISFRHLLIMASIFELAVGLVCLISGRLALPLRLIAWLATNLLLYRIGLIAVHYHKPCSCLGNLTENIGLSAADADLIMKFLLAYLLMGSYGSLIWLGFRNRKHDEIQNVHDAAAKW